MNGTNEGANLDGCCGKTLDIVLAWIFPVIRHNRAIGRFAGGKPPSHGIVHNSFSDADADD